jgi:phage shock protein PspC (stress-responsive transcriptional regulator)
LFVLTIAGWLLKMFLIIQVFIGVGGFLMSTSKIILTAIMAGIYSGILNNFEVDSGLTRIASILIVVILTFITGYLLNRVDLSKNKQ